MAVDFTVVSTAAGLAFMVASTVVAMAPLFTAAPDGLGQGR